MSAQPKPDGGPAFPVVASTGDPRDGVYCRDGMTLRDYFAAAALQGLLSQSPDSIFCATKSATHLASEKDNGWAHIAAMAYAASDAMLDERNK